MTRFEHDAPRSTAREEALVARLVRDERLHLRASADLAVQIAEQLTELHRRGAIHGELSPANVTVALEGEPLRITVLGLTHVAARRGTPHFPEPDMGYASPETLLGFAPDSRVDCWAFGVLLYRCVYGRLPFRGRTPEELLTAFARALHVPGCFGAEADALLAGFFERCFTHRSAGRLSSARTIGATFAALVSEAERICEDPFSFRPQTSQGQIVPISAGRTRF